MIPEEEEMRAIDNLIILLRQHRHNLEYAASIKAFTESGKPFVANEYFEYHKDMVNNPEHYKGRKFECIDIIEDFNLGFNLGNALKYILRAGKKDSYAQDIKKAIWYLEREVEWKKTSTI